MSRSDLKKAITPALVRRMAGERSYNLAAEMARHGHVTAVEENGGVVSARVYGGAVPYPVKFWASDGFLDYACECEKGGRQELCEHVAAAVLSWMPAEAGRKKAKGRKPKISPADVRETLLDADHEELVAKLIAWSAHNAELADDLRLFAAEQIDPEAVPGIAIESGIGLVKSRYNIYKETLPFELERLAKAQQRLGWLMDGGYHYAAIELSEELLARAIYRLSRQTPHDERVKEWLAGIAKLHRQACEELRPKPGNLARSLLSLEVRCDSLLFKNAVRDYGDLLGEPGIAAYQQQLIAWIEEVRSRPVDGTKPSDSLHNSELLAKLVRMLRRFADWRRDLDLEKIVARYSRDFAYAEQATQKYLEAGRLDDALECAEAAVRCDSPYSTEFHGLHLLLQVYERRGEPALGLEKLFDALAYPETGSRRFAIVKRLNGAAHRHGLWARFRPRILQVLEEAVERSSEAKDPYEPARAVGTLVEFHIAEGELETASNLVRTHAVSADVMVALAEALSEDRPAAAAEQYLLASAKVRDTHYEPNDTRLIALLEKAACCYRQAGRGRDFAERVLAHTRNGLWHPRSRTHISRQWERLVSLAESEARIASG